MILKLKPVWKADPWIIRCLLWIDDRWDELLKMAEDYEKRERKEIGFEITKWDEKEIFTRMGWHTKEKKISSQDLFQGIYLLKLKYFPKEKEKWMKTYEKF
jgi:hypothetical protein